MTEPSQRDEKAKLRSYSDKDALQSLGVAKRLEAQEEESSGSSKMHTEADGHRPVQDSGLLKEILFQLTVTKAMLKTLDLDQILYIILSGITHGDGLNFNRALLFLAWDRRNEIRISQSAGPASGEEAHRIWEGIKAEALDLQSLLDRYNANHEEIPFLTSKLLGFSLKIDDVKEMETLDANSYAFNDIISHCVATKQAFLFNGVEAVYNGHNPDDRLVFKYFACVPVFLNNEVFGVIFTDNFYNNRSIQLEELRALSVVANLASIALERAMLYRKISEMAKVDGLTGVFNRRYYERFLYEEFMRSKRLKRALTMIVFDIDHFKRCNDLYGHECGDRILKQFAQVLQSNTREEDMVARYGGEEFVLLLAGEQTPQSVWAAGEKLRRIVEATAFAHFLPGELTTSAGVSFVDSDDDFAQLFSRADQALYQAKRAGRNRVKIYGHDENQWTVE